MKIYKIAKHVSFDSHTCIYCKTNLQPISFRRNSKHHFPWGIVYKCRCNQSGLWTNSIRGDEEFIKHVFKDKPLEEFHHLQGFCNDLYCPECFSYVGPIKNGLLLDSQNRPGAWDPINQQQRYITDYRGYIKAYNERSDLSPYFGVEMSHAARSTVTRSVDVYGCRSLDHNIGIISNGYETEYGEGEYAPIYKWIKTNKSLIPPNMKTELSGNTHFALEDVPIIPENL